MAMGELVLQLYAQISASPGLLDLKDELEVLEGVCRAISRQAQNTKEDSSVLPKRIIQPIGARLSENFKNPSCKPKQDISPELDRLTLVVRFYRHLHRNQSDHRCCSIELVLVGECFQSIPSRHGIGRKDLQAQ